MKDATMSLCCSSFAKENRSSHVLNQLLVVSVLSAKERRPVCSLSYLQLKIICCFCCLYAGYKRSGTEFEKTKGVPMEIFMIKKAFLSRIQATKRDLTHNVCSPTPSRYRKPTQLPLTNTSSFLHAGKEFERYWPLVDNV